MVPHPFDLSAVIELDPKRTMPTLAMAVAPPAAIVDGVVVGDAHEEAMKMQHAFVKEYFTVRSGQGFYLKVKKQVAEGDRSGVYLIEDLCSDKLSALKMVPSQGNHLLSIHVDIAVLQKFDHPCILKCLDHFTFSIRQVPFLCVQYEFCEKGTLRECLMRKRERNVAFSTSSIIHIMTQLASALEYVHEQGCLHGDVQSQNTLYTAERHIKLTKFGHIRVPRSRARSLTITGGGRLYAPPEWGDSCLPDHELSAVDRPCPSYDAWGMGCVLAELATTTLLEDRGNGERLTGAEWDGLVTEAKAAQHGAFAAVVAGLLTRDCDDRMDVRTAHRLLDSKHPARLTRFFQPFKITIANPKRSA